MRRIWVSGYRAFELAVFSDRDPRRQVVGAVLRDRLRQWLNESDEESWLLSGPQLGVEQWALRAGLDLKADYPQLRVAMMLPFADFGQRLNEAHQATLVLLRDQVDFAAEVSPRPYQSPQQLRDYQRFMFDHTDQLLLVYDPDQESEEGNKSKPYWLYRAAQALQEDGADYPISLIDMDALQEGAEEWAARQHPEAN